MLWSLTSPELGLLIDWLPLQYNVVHDHDNDEAQALPHAGTLELLFLATRAESRSLCVGIALVLRDMHRQASSASWHVLLSHRLEPKLRCMRSIIYWRQGPQDSALFLRQGPQSGALLYVHDGSCTSGNTAQVAIPTIGLGIDIRSHVVLQPSTIQPGPETMHFQYCSCIATKHNPARKSKEAFAV